MYEGFFHLQSRPFPASPVVANYFPAQSMEAAHQNLIRVIGRAEGPGIVIGPSGVGKTLLLRVLADQFASSLRAVVLAGTRITTRKSLLQNILFELNLPYRGMDEGELRLELIDALRRGETIPHGILLLLDEAHLLPLRLLDEARLITNVVQDGQPRVRLVLAGSPQLEDRFTSPLLDSFSQRIAARCYLQTFTREETHEYIRAELSWAGGDPDAIITDDAIRAVFRASDGVPRLVNQVCDHALVMAQSVGVRPVTPELIQESWADLQQLPPPWEEPRPMADRPSASTIIEFGQLDEGPARESLEASSPLEQDYDRSFGAPTPTNRSEYASDSMLINSPFLEQQPEWTNCVEPEAVAEVELPRHVEANPFADDFEEEQVVIDRTTAQLCDGFRGRPRVSCSEGREIAEALGFVQSPERPLAARATSDAGCLVSDSLAVPAFEFSTLQDLPAIDGREEFTPMEADVHEPAEQIEVSFEEEADLVKLPWTRGSLGDDRDIIHVEDDAPAVTTTEIEVLTNGKRTEYRELFSQLRKASS